MEARSISNAGEAVSLIRENIAQASLVEELIPRALPSSEGADQIVLHSYELFQIFLSASGIERKQKRHYASLIQSRVAFYLAFENKGDVGEKTIYQSAFNKMFNDFMVFTESGSTTFSRELGHFSGWKGPVATLLGLWTFYRFYPAIRENIRKKDQPGLAATKLTRRKARYATAGAAVAAFAVSYLLWSGIKTVLSRWGEPELSPCLPPFCPRIDFGGNYGD